VQIREEELTRVLIHLLGNGIALESLLQSLIAAQLLEHRTAKYSDLVKVANALSENLAEKIKQRSIEFEDQKTAKFVLNVASDAIKRIYADAADHMKRTPASVAKRRRMHS